MLKYFAILFLFTIHFCIAQDSLNIVAKPMAFKLDSNFPTSIQPIKGNAFFPYSKKKEKQVAISQAIGYATNFASLYAFWYKDYPQSNFHFFNDYGEYLQVDKVSHMFGAYIGGKMSMQMWKWAGASKKKYIWLGGMSGLAYETLIEVMDGFSDHWGFSCGDYGANVLGTSLLVGQELAWNEQRLQIKYSTHYQHYNDPNLERFAQQVDGISKIDRIFKDYTPQTYWLSANINLFLKNQKYQAG
jgi:Predicted periplasmic lipoprotein (DUF2279)